MKAKYYGSFVEHLSKYGYRLISHPVELEKKSEWDWAGFKSTCTDSQVYKLAFGVEVIEGCVGETFIADEMVMPTDRLYIEFPTWFKHVYIDLIKIDGERNMIIARVYGESWDNSVKYNFRPTI